MNPSLNMGRIPTEPIGLCKAFVFILFFLFAGCNVEKSRNAEVQRIGMVIKIKEEAIDEYLKLHSPENPGVRDLLTKYNIYNFSIFLQKLDDGNYYEFGYYEYAGSNLEDDMENLAKEPRNIEWLKICDPMQIPLEGKKGWTKMKQIYHNE